MRKHRVLPVFILLLGGFFALLSCKNLTESFPETRRIKTYYNCPSTLLYIGENCLVYGEDALFISGVFAEEVADEFDIVIYDTITGAFGYPSDIDDNDRIIIFLLDIEEDTHEGVYTAGYFYPNDLLRGEILYLNYNSTIIQYSNYRDNLYPAIAHEFQHLINRSLHLYNPMDVWIDEGLASAAEYLYKEEHRSDRIDWFNEDPYQTIRKGNNFFIWDGYWENQGANSDLLGNYATAYLFFQWLRIHADNDSEIYRDIIDSQYTDYRAVTNAAKQRISAFSGITNDDAGWAKLLGDWYAANRLRAGSGIYGYKNQITLNFTWGWPGSHDARLYPGEGVYSQISGSINNGSLTGTPTIRYLGLKPSNTVISVPPYNSTNSTYLLTYNGSAEITNGAATGYAADMVPVSLMTMAARSGGTGESQEAILKRWDGGRVFLEKLRESGAIPQD